MAFTKATKKQSKLRLALIGPSGSGKTYTALTLASGLGEKVALIDTERGSASKYANLFGFDVQELDSFHPDQYIRAIAEAAEAGYDVLVIDSLSHAWSGKGGALEMVDQFAKQDKSGNSFSAWRNVTPVHNRMVDAIISAPLHIIVTMRSKMEYSQEKDERGRTVIRKVGLQPVQRDGLEYEFDVVADMDQDNTLVVTKTRCPDLVNVVIEKPTKNLAAVLRSWLEDGEPVKLERYAQSQPRPTNGTQQPPAPRPAPQPAPQQSQADAQPIIRSPRYGREVVAFVNQVPYYANKQGSVDGFHITGTLKKLGIMEVTDANIDTVWAKLRQYAEDQQVLKGAPEPELFPQEE